MPGLIRNDGRRAGELRPVRITPDFVRKADGSCLIELGGTRVICTASLVGELPRWRKDSCLGWLTAEYGMLPASTSSRKPRPVGKADCAAVEIQRIIGRVLRNVVRMDRLGENTVYLDCDVLEADGGTRTAAITGSAVALARALDRAARDGRCAAGAMKGLVAAVSAGMVGGRALLDLDYSEDSTADVDMNVAMLGGGKLVEVQASSERAAFTARQLATMLALARRGIRQLMILQKEALAARRRR